MQITEVAGVTIIQGDALESLRAFPDRSIHCCVTSPPYWGLRDYGVAGQLGLEPTPTEYVENLVNVFREVRRVLRDDGTLWLNLGDTYGTGTKAPRTPGNLGVGTGQQLARDAVPRAGGVAKQLLGIPWRVAFALQADGWYLRQDIIWHKPNPMPESVRDRCTKSHEYIFLLAKSEKYYFDCDAIRQPYADKTKSAWGCDFKGRGDGTGLIAAENMAASIATHEPHPKGANKRDVWTVATKPFKEAHFATFPPDLIEPCVLAGCPPAGKRCDCDVVINTPTGTVEADDPSMTVGRAGMARPRGLNEGSRPITRREQRWHADQMRESPHRAEMGNAAGPAFDHYIRTDVSGARPLPETLRAEFALNGWISEAPPCTHPIESAGTVLDPFGGAGTTGLVAQRHGRLAVLLELNPEYATMAANRIAGDALKAAA